MLVTAACLAVLGCAPEPSEPLSVHTDFENWRTLYPNTEVFVVERGGVTYTVPEIPGFSIGVRQAQEGVAYHLSFQLARPPLESGFELGPARFTSELKPPLRNGAEILAARYDAHLQFPDNNPNPVSPAMAEAACPNMACDEVVVFGNLDCDSAQSSRFVDIYDRPFFEFAYFAKHKDSTITAICYISGVSYFDEELVTTSCSGNATRDGYYAGIGHVEVQADQCGGFLENIQDNIRAFDQIARIITGDEL
jgi:hypothetical protein